MQPRRCSWRADQRIPALLYSFSHQMFIRSRHRHQIYTTVYAPLLLLLALNVDAQQNFCDQSSSFLTRNDGTQQQQQQSTCASAQLGAIPVIDKMVSTLIVEPENGERIGVKSPFTVKLLTRNMELGHFEDPKTKYLGTLQQE